MVHTYIYKYIVHVHISEYYVLHVHVRKNMYYIGGKKMDIHVHTYVHVSTRRTQALLASGVDIRGMCIYIYIRIRTHVYVNLKLEICTALQCTCKCIFRKLVQFV